MTDKKLVKGLAHLGEPVKGPEASNVVSLPLWREAKRGMPISFIRTVLFSTIQSEERRWLDDEIIYSEQGITVKFQGKQLNQEDLILWETLVRRAKHHSLDTECTFTGPGLLTAMGLPVDEKSLEKLHSGIIRLIACLVQFSDKRNLFFGSPINNSIRDQSTGYYTVRLNKKFIQLYDENQWSVIFCEG